MADPFEVIAAFVDGERVDPVALKAALSTAEGRDYLADIVALGEVIDDGAPTAVPVTAQPAARGRRWLAAAAIVVSLAGGYALGNKFGRSDRASVGAQAKDAAPPPTRVIELKWQESTGGH